jgi:hypothetical protein
MTAVLANRSRLLAVRTTCAWQTRAVCKAVVDWLSDWQQPGGVLLCRPVDSARHGCGPVPVGCAVSYRSVL